MFFRKRFSPEIGIIKRQGRIVFISDKSYLGKLGFFFGTCIEWEDMCVIVIVYVIIIVDVIVIIIIIIRTDSIISKQISGYQE